VLAQVGQSAAQKNQVGKGVGGGEGGGKNGQETSEGKMDGRIWVLKAQGKARTLDQAPQQKGGEVKIGAPIGTWAFYHLAGIAEGNGKENTAKGGGSGTKRGKKP